MRESRRNSIEINELDTDEVVSTAATPASPTVGISTMLAYLNNADDDWDKINSDDDLTIIPTTYPSPERSQTPSEEPSEQQPTFNRRKIPWVQLTVICLSLLITGLLCLALPSFAYQICAVWVAMTTTVGVSCGIQRNCNKKDNATPTSSANNSPDAGNRWLNDMRATSPKNITRKKSSTSVSEPFNSSPLMYQPSTPPLIDVRRDLAYEDALKNRELRIGHSPVGTLR